MVSEPVGAILKSDLLTDWSVFIASALERLLEWPGGQICNPNFCSDGRTQEPFLNYASDFG